MNYMYSKTTNQFYIPGVHGDIPPDATVCSADVVRRVLSEIRHGFALSPAANGDPAVVEFAASLDELMEAARLRRDAVISSTMWIVERHRDQLELGIETSISTEKYTELLTYHQALRDWPARLGWPDIDMPQSPEWLP